MSGRTHQNSSPNLRPKYPKSTTENEGSSRLLCRTYTVPVGGSRVGVLSQEPQGVSKKLAHNYHGPYRIVAFLSPVHCILRATDNRRVSTTVHVSRLKRYIDPADRPSREPPFQIEEPFLADSDLPMDSFISEDLNLDLSRHQALTDSDDVDTAPSPATNVPPVLLLVRSVLLPP